MPHHKDKPSSTTSLHQTFQQEGAVFQEDQDLQPAELLDHPSYIELQQKLTEAEEKANQLWERVLRMQAEADNAQRRAQRDVESAHKFALEKFVSELLPIVDNLERAVASVQDKSLLEGVILTLNMFYKALEKFGVEQIDPLSQLFNPELHQAVSTETDPEIPAGTILNVLQKGYLLNNRLVRPALVVVSKIN